MTMQTVALYGNSLVVSSIGATSPGGAIYGDDVLSVSDSTCWQGCPDPARHYDEDPAKASARLMANEQMEV